MKAKNLVTAATVSAALSFSVIAQAKEALREQGLPFDSGVAIGGMIEIPAAVLAISTFLRRLDFLSIGTNDLIQYTLAIDRADEAVSHLYDPWHPAVLLLIARTIEEARRGEPSQETLDLAAETITLTDAEIRERMSGNICRCSAYPQILEAIRDIAGAASGESA